MRPELEKLVREGMSRYHVPGVAIGILHDGDEDIAAYGVTNLEHPLPVDADTLFQIASITKTMTATCPEGQRAVSAVYHAQNVDITESVPSSDLTGWTVTVVGRFPGGAMLLTALCANS